MLVVTVETPFTGLLSIGCIGCYYSSGSEGTVPASEGHQTIMDYLQT